ncbi:MAG TPA: cupin domain-containing protein [Candidatus Deferrimicrobiaceae bacterium]|nr:cupin domain-containing protein [Candidatus Deferrimicrobiaceae bacterium]
MTEPAGPRPDRPAAGPVFHARLGEQMERLRREPAWRSGDRNAITLFKAPALRLVLLGLKAGARLHEHRADGSLTVQVVSGAVRVDAGGRRVDLAPGEVLVLEPGLDHALEAGPESTVLLTLAGGS